MTVTAISTSTITSSTAYVDFTIDDTYDEILFTYAGVKGTVDERPLGFQVVTSNGTRNRPVQSAFYYYWHYVHDYSAGGPNYQSAWDKLHTAAASGSPWVNLYVGGDTHETYTSGSGELRFFKPANTTFYKFFQSDSTAMKGHTADWHRYLTHNKQAGYVRDTAALTSIRFQMISYDGTSSGAGNINYATISMYGIS